MMELTSMLHSVPPPHSDTDIHGMTVTEWGGPPDSWTGTEKPGARSSRLSVFIAPPDVTSSSSSSSSISLSLLFQPLFLAKTYTPPKSSGNVAIKSMGSASLGLQKIDNMIIFNYHLQQCPYNVSLSELHRVSTGQGFQISAIEPNIKSNACRTL